MGKSVGEGVGNKESTREAKETDDGDLEVDAGGVGEGVDPARAPKLGEGPHGQLLWQFPESPERQQELECPP